MILTILTYALAIYICISVFLAGLCVLALVRTGSMEQFVALANMMARKETGKDLGYTKANVTIIMVGLVLFWPVFPIIARKR